jgi:hypothetical protein
LIAGGRQYGGGNIFAGQSRVDHRGSVRTNAAS